MLLNEWHSFRKLVKYTTVHLTFKGILLNLIWIVSENHSAKVPKSEMLDPVRWQLKPKPGWSVSLERKKSKVYIVLLLLLNFVSTKPTLGKRWKGKIVSAVNSWTKQRFSTLFIKKNKFRVTPIPNSPQKIHFCSSLALVKCHAHKIRAHLF